MENRRERKRKLHVWLSDEELNQARKSADKLNLTVSSFVRMAIVGIRPVEKPDERFHEEMNRILEMANKVEDLRQQFVRTGMPDRVGLEQEVKIWKQFRREIQKRYLTSPEENLL